MTPFQRNSDYNNVYALSLEVNFCLPRRVLYHPYLPTAIFSSLRMWKAIIDGVILQLRSFAYNTGYILSIAMRRTRLRSVAFTIGRSDCLTLLNLQAPRRRIEVRLHSTKPMRIPDPFVDKSGHCHSNHDAEAKGQSIG